MQQTACSATQRLPHDQLERLAMLGLCVAEILHEFSTPLTCILGRLLLMQHPTAPPLDDATRESVARLDEHASRMKWLVEQIRMIFFHGRSVAALIHPQLDDLNETVRAAVRTAQDLAAPGQITFDEAYSDIPQVPFDWRWLRHAVLNLVTNAVEAMEGAGVIAIRTAWRSAASVAVSVSDTGPGIEPKVLDTLFRPLVTTKGGNGLGLGLALARDIVAAHRGWIEVASAPGHGATFRIVLPTGRNGGPA